MIWLGLSILVIVILLGWMWSRGIVADYPYDEGGDFP